MNIIELKNVSRQHQGHVILKNIDLTIPKGSFTVITGSSGSGKSTLLQILGMLDPVTQGQYKFDGSPINHLDINQLSILRNHEIGFIFQRFHLFPHLNSLENVCLPLMYQKNKDQKRAKQLLTAFNLADKMMAYPHELSYGQQQRVAIARALVTRPSVILADEPTGSLDPDNAHQVIQQLKQAQQNGHTVILVTHDPSTIPTDATHLILDQQRIQHAT